MSGVQKALRRELSFLSHCDNEDELSAALDAYREWEQMSSILVAEAKRRKHECYVNRLTGRIRVMIGER